MTLGACRVVPNTTALKTGLLREKGALNCKGKFSRGGTGMFDTNIHQSSQKPGEKKRT